MKKSLETQRLSLRILREKDAKQVLAYFVESQRFLVPWEPSRPQGFYTEEFHKRQLQSEWSLFEEGRLLRYWIFKKEDEKRIIGALCFSNIVYGNFLSCFMGYRLNEIDASRGFMTEAVEKGCEVMFSEYGLHRIEANVMPRNKASMRVLEKSGFVNEGVSPKYLKINGIWEDHIHMVLLNDRNV